MVKLDGSRRESTRRVEVMEGRNQKDVFDRINRIDMIENPAYH
tara:strand:- start:337 stop:465 length:129 start_codon:yes stop_codon:yes gene_type:complete